VRLRRRKAKAVLGYLLLSESGEESRERLVGLLWSESEEEKARASLRQVLHELREVLEGAGFAGFRADKLTLALPPAVTETDVRSLCQAVAAGETPPLLLDTPDLPETLLQGLDDLDPAFRVWLLAARQALLDRLTRGLEAAMRLPGQPALALQHAARGMLRLDPTHEEATRILMLSLAQQGDSSGALRLYDALWQLLDKEFDAEPTGATQKLYAEIKLGLLEPAAAEPPPAPPVAAPAVPGTVQRLALQVERFAVNGIGPEQLHLTEGFRHDLIGCLARFREWFVVDGPNLPPSERLGDRVSGRYRMAATAYRAGAGIIMVLTLVEADTGTVLWGERFDLALDRWFDMQQRIVRQVAVALKLQLSSARLNRLAAEPAVSLPAFDRWLRSQHVMQGFRGDAWEHHLDLLRATIAEAPGFAPAHSGLAQMLNGAHIVRPGTRRGRAREQEALAHARRAAELDERDARSQLCLGWALAMAGKHRQAAVHMRLAIDLNPLDSWVLISCALFHAFQGEHERAEALAAESLAMTLVPNQVHFGYLASILYLRGDYLGTLDACDRADDVIRTLPAWRAAALANLGRHAEARESATRFLRLAREYWVVEGVAESVPDDAAVMRWLLHLYPMAQAGEWERLRDGTAAAGLPTRGMRFGDW
jgi:DNA-binding SARP family transcriptional activator